MYLKDNHTNLPFKLVHLKPDAEEDKNTLAHRHNYFELFVFENEGKQHLIDFETYEVASESIHLVLPGCVHLLLRNARTTGFVLLFSEDFYMQNQIENKLWHLLIPSLLKNGAALKLDTESFQKIVVLCRQLADTKEPDIQRTYLQLIIQHLIAAFQFQKLFIENKANSVAYEFRKLVENHFSEEHKMSFYAEKLNLNSTALSIKVKETFGISPLEILQDRLILEAKRMLMHYEYSSKEIAFSLGFKDDSYFSKFFKSKTGFSALDFRKKYR